MKRHITKGLMLLAATAFVLSAGPVSATGPRACVREAKQDAKDCTAVCKEDLQAAKDACLNRDHACVEVCRADRSQCRLDTGFDAAIDSCNDLLEANRAQCRANNPPGADRDHCIDLAQINAFECRDSVRESAKPLLKQCRKDFRACAKACPPAGPAEPVDTKQCMLDANMAAKACTAACKEDFQVAKDDCHNRDHECVEDCRAQRTTCRQPVNQQLNDALGVCAADKQEGIHGTADDGDPSCDQQFPPPQDPQAVIDYDQCVDGEQVEAFICRDDAHEAAHPGFVACHDGFRDCVTMNCPPLPEN